jgi:hypothetical protein
MSLHNLWRLLAAAVVAVSGLTVSVAQAANIAVWSPIGGSPDLPAGHTYTAVSGADIDNGLLSSYDALLLGHIYDTISTTTCSQLQTFLNAGKGVVSEWNGATLLFTQTGSLPISPVNMSCTLFPGTVTGGRADFGSNLPITLAIPSSPLVSGLSNPFSMQGGSEFVFRIAGLGAEWTVAGTSDLGGTVYPTVMAAKYNGAGCVALSPFDYFDTLRAGSNSQILLSNMLNYVLNPQNGCAMRASSPAVPVPALSNTMLWLLCALVLLAAAPAVQRSMRR